MFDPIEVYWQWGGVLCFMQSFRETQANEGSAIFKGGFLGHFGYSTSSQDIREEKDTGGRAGLRNALTFTHIPLTST